MESVKGYVCITKEKRNNPGAYQGSKCFSYNGKVLSELRKEIGKE